MITREQKEQTINKIKDHIERSDAVFLTNLIGIPSVDSVNIRRKVSDTKGNVIVARNTFFRIAAKGTHLEKALGNLKGTNAVAFSFENPPALAKVIYEAKKDFELVDFKGGFLGDKELSVEEITSLAKLPSREELLGTLLATFMAPISAFARVMNSIKEQKEEASGGEAKAAEEAPASE